MSRRRDTVVPFRKPSRAVPPTRARNRPGRGRKGRGFAALRVALPLATFTAVFVFGVPGAASLTLPARHRAAVHDSETARFALCEGPVRANCVVDGDTFWYGGEKIRIADINAPEVSEPDCAHEAELGAEATDRLLTLLNQGAPSPSRPTTTAPGATTTSTAARCASSPATARAWARRWWTKGWRRSGRGIAEAGAELPVRTKQTVSIAP